MKKIKAAFNRQYGSIKKRLDTESGDAQIVSKIHGIHDQFNLLMNDCESLSEKSRRLSKEIGALKKSGEDASAQVSKKKDIDSKKINPIKIRAQECIDALGLIQSELNNSEKETGTEIAKKVDEPTVVEPKSDIALDISQISCSIAENEQAYLLADEFCSSMGEGTLYHLSGWKKIIEPVFKNPFYLLVAKDSENKVVGILPFVRLKSLLFGDFCVSVPYFNYGGPIAVNDAVEQCLIKEAINVANKMGVEHFEFRGVKKREELGLPCRSNKVNMLLSLPDNIQTLKTDLKAKVRSQIKKAEQTKHEIQIGGIELLDDFYKIFSINMRDLGTPVYSKKWFEQILLLFPKESRLVILKIKDKPVSAGFLAGYKNRLEIPWASTLKEYNKYNANMLMYWHILQYAVRQGYQEFDFGRSTMGCNTYKFKKQWGADPETLYWYYWLKGEAELPELNPDNIKFKILIAVWKKLPVFIANIIGPFLVAKLP